MLVGRHDNFIKRSDRGVAVVDQDGIAGISAIFPARWQHRNRMVESVRRAAAAERPKSACAK